ncbi:olee1-like protein [Rhododendron vialii]|uniref:olee1-like protein n=1 Tax=Rhododendron vialii TaxID=182163 RepID=UPI00265ECD0D|nr:olee1-like protein [Rhododendron vialii]
MAKAIALVASALCFLAVAAADGSFSVEGLVYCDGCRVLFYTGVGGKIGQADVELQCRDRENGTVTLTKAQKSDDGGYYAIYIDKDHQNDICEVRVVSSPIPECREIVPAIASNRVNLARDSGIITNSRFVNPIGFVNKNAYPECHDVLDAMGFIPQV